MFRRTLYSLIALLLPPLAVFSQTKRPLDHDAYEIWRAIDDEALSNDGRWILYALTLEDGDSELKIHSLRAEATYSIPRASSVRFTHDSRFVVALVAPEQALIEQAKRDKKKSDEMPQDSLVVLDLASGEVFKAAQVKSFAVPEVLLYTLLEQHLGVAPERRFANLAKNLGARDALRRARETGQQAKASAPEPSRKPSALPVDAVPTPLAEGEELIDEASFAKLHEELVLRGRADQSGEGDGSQDEILLDEVEANSQEAFTSVPFEDPPENPGEIARLEARISGAADRDEIATLAVRLARAYVGTAALFLVQGGTMAGLRGDSSELERRIQGIVIPLATESRFAQVGATREPWRGEPPGDGVDARVVRALGRESAREMVLLPICIRDRVVSARRSTS